MYLKSIRVNGFKSFADKIDLQITSGITGVVGPNGSGKSNIVDAIKWVLGEQSVKALRGDSSMVDVIFAGSKTRNASTRSSVALVFDNSDKYLNSEFNEIEVKRVLYKSGENEYYINNTKVRLKDVTDLFLDSGAGKGSFNIISQGAVADIINSKPEDRRTLFEEAAGVLKYKKRKEESFRKLDRTNENLARVNLLIDELEVSLEPLKKQSEAARKYLDYKEELRNIEIALIATDIKRINDEYVSVKEKIDLLTDEVEKLSLSNDTDNSKVEELKLNGLKFDNEIEEKTNKINDLTREIAELQSKKQITIERQKYEISSDKLKENIIVLKEELLNLDNTIKDVTNEVDSLRKELDVKQLKSMDLIKTNEDNKNTRNNLIDNNNSISKTILNLSNKIEILNDNINNDIKLPYSVKNVINNIRLKGIHGVLSKLIEVPKKFVTAIEISLGANGNVIVVDKEKDAKEAINYLKENRLGRATFFPISVIKARNIIYEDLEKIKKDDGYIGVASELVKYEDVYKDIVLNQLGNVIVVDNIDSMNRIGKLINYKYKVVTLTGDIQFAGGAMTGGTVKNNTGVINQKYELEELSKELNKNKEALKQNEINLVDINKKINKVSSELEVNQKDVVMLTEQLNVKSSYLKDIKNSYDNKNNELSGYQNKKDNKLDKELDSILKEYYEKVALKESLEKELSKVKADKSDLTLEINDLEKAYRDANNKINSKQNELKLAEVKKGKMDVSLDNLLLTLNENYNLTYEKAYSEYSLDVDSETARLTVNNLKAKILSLGDVNTGSIAEYDRINERYTFLVNQKTDLETSVTSLLSVIEEMDEIMKIRFLDTFNKVKEEFSNVFKKLFKGGDGVLELTNPDDLLNTGIEISALPPGKKLNSIALLSGGEKTLTAIALLFAVLNVKPVPFVVLDEVEAALDDTNVETFGNYLLSCKERSQFIIITHKKKTMEYADTLYGVTMQESGVSKLVSVKLEG